MGVACVCWYSWQQYCNNCATAWSAAGPGCVPHPSDCAGSGDALQPCLETVMQMDPETVACPTAFPMPVVIDGRFTGRACD
jgi:hypothetical protein